MTNYILRRLFAVIPVMLGASLIIFFTLRLFAPINVIEEALAATPGAGDPAVEERLRQEFGLDKPIYQQYVLWLWGAVRGDMGTSWTSGQPVFKQLLNALPVSLEITILSLILAVVIGIPLGVISAIQQNKWPDYACRFFAVFGLSVPSFVVAALLLLVPAMTWGWAPPVGYVTPWEDFNKHAQQMLLPLISLGTIVSATSVRILRSTMLEVLRNEYVRTARAKGLEERVVVYRHALRNALIPVVTILGTQVSFTLGGTVVVEQIFSLPGVGRLTLLSIQRGDYPQLQANVLYLLLIFLIANLIVDISYAWFDPRIRYD